jgi:putative hemolysin
MTATTTALVVVMLLCLAASALFSGSETALVGLPRERLPQLAARGTRGRRLEALIRDMEGTLATLLVANNFVNILSASIGTILSIELVTALADPDAGQAWGPWMSTVVLTAIILVVGEITPKTLAARRSEQFSMVVAPTIWWLGRIIAPVSKVFIAAARAVLRLFGIRGHVVAHATEEDIVALALLSEEAGQIHPEERLILQSLFSLADRPVRDVMTPRVEVESIDAGSPVSAVRQAIAIHGHSRFPVVKPGGTLDDLVGVLYVKDLLRGTETPTIDEIVRDAVFVPESASVLGALQELRSKRVGFAVVLDEHGGVEGIVTVKDLMSELVGEIQDEYDPREPSLYQLGDRMWVVEGRVAVSDVSDETGFPLPDGPFTSMAGLFLWLSGRIPVPGDVAEAHGARLTVLRMDRRRIDRLRLELPGEPGDGHQPIR